MIKELYQIRTRQISLSISCGEIDAVRRKELVKSGCRVYDGGYLGVSGTLGEPTEETWQAAERALQTRIPYPGAPAEGLVRSRRCGSMPEEIAFIAQAEQVLATLKKEFPAFVLSNKIYATEETRVLKNDLGLCLQDVQCVVSVEIVVKEEASANVFDTFIIWSGREFDGEKVLANGREVLSAHCNRVPMPAQPIPVVMSEDMRGELAVKFGEYLNIRRLKKNASPLSGREGEKLFSERFGIQIGRDETSYLPFFDAEGTVLPEDRLPLIENGVLVRGTADKLCAAEFGTELTASANGGYDDVPTLQSNGLQIVPTAPLRELLQGRDAICIMIASGGDITPEGDYATPVQAAYLCRDGKLIGRLPEFRFRGSIFDLLGKDYLGCCTDATPTDEHALVTMGQIDV